MIKAILSMCVFILFIVVGVGAYWLVSYSAGWITLEIVRLFERKTREEIRRQLLGNSNSVADLGAAVVIVIAMIIGMGTLCAIFGEGLLNKLTILARME